MTLRALALSLVAAALLATPAAAQTLRITGGEIAAAPAAADGVRVYKGLPYAAPPVGERRWKPPEPVQPWTGVRPVDAYAPNCLQPKRYDDIDPFTPSMSEDCLYLNITTAAKPTEKLPVFFWIHGGGYGAGSGSEPRHDGQALARKGMVVVTINYRLGVFGFLAHPELTAESPRHASGDQALADMVAALRWVKANVAAFGGDPDNVTIAGESAGSDAVSRMMISPEAKGLFHRAIGESGSAFSMMGDDQTLAQAEAVGQAFARSLGGDDLKRLRERSSAEILAASMAPNAAFAFRPNLDGWILPATAAQTFAARQQSDVPLLVGWNRDEGSLFQGAIFGERALQPVLAERFGPRVGDALALYPADPPAVARASQQTYAGDLWMGLPTWRWAVAQTQTGKSPVYVYRFDHAPRIPDGWFGAANRGKDFGAFHSADIVYVFDHPEILKAWTTDAVDRRVADQTSSYWVNFARAGDPNGPGLPAWTPYDPATPKKMLIGPETRLVDDPDIARLRFQESAGK
ncbi:MULTISPECIES: carboxylesterase family protein [unclassified Caulobacter]|uniref:carboxylesterase/lipase family protein n=1 Tax=unclassified Caulobacter TaxID=2648921 RepID=UPI000556F7EF|nr:carboxylesterase family protein [Caulobacter sp. UNC358MFTsu5.1]